MLAEDLIRPLGSSRRIITDALPRSLTQIYRGIISQHFVLLRLRSWPQASFDLLFFVSDCFTVPSTIYCRHSNNSTMPGVISESASGLQTPNGTLKMNGNHDDQDRIKRFGAPSRASSPPPQHLLFHPKTRCFV